MGKERVAKKGRVGEFDAKKAKVGDVVAKFEGKDLKRFMELRMKDGAIDETIDRLIGQKGDINMKVFGLWAKYTQYENEVALHERGLALALVHRTGETIVKRRRDC